ncbi:MAG: copper chaperone PCu(A)C [Alphaproteobacteria bacterium]
MRLIGPLAALLLLMGSAHAAGVEVTDAWARATPGSSENAAVYFTLANKAGVDDTLLSAASPAAETAELHRTVTAGGISIMEQSKGVRLEAGATIRFAPGGLHLMLMKLKKPLKEGDKITVTLDFEKAGAVTTEVPVLGAASMGPRGD